MKKKIMQKTTAADNDEWQSAQKCSDKQQWVWISEEDSHWYLFFVIVVVDDVVACLIFA